MENMGQEKSLATLTHLEIVNNYASFYSIEI